MQHLEKLLKACANQKRLCILKFLKERRVLCVHDLADLLKVPEKTASRHLRILAAADIVASRRKGKEVYYAMSKYHNAIIKNIMNIL